jgi:hypothetical protein
MKAPYLLLYFGLSCLVIQGCATPSKKGYDPAAYSTYLTHMPGSILVLPPQNESIDVMAPYIYLSTITRSLAERGYYVYPVAVVDALMKENGVPTPAEMAQIPLKKIKEVIHPDAVLYMTIVRWGVKYQLIDTHAIVHIRGRLVDTDSGALLWRGEHSLSHHSSAGYQGNVVEMLAGAFIDKIASSVSDPTRNLAYTANRELFNNPQEGLLIGRRHPKYLEEQNRFKNKPGKDARK